MNLLSLLEQEIAKHDIDSFSQDSGQHCVCRSDSRFEQRNGDLPWSSIEQHIAQMIVVHVLDAHSTSAEARLVTGVPMSAEMDVKALAFVVCPDLEHTIHDGHDQCDETTARILASDWLANLRAEVACTAANEAAPCGINHPDSLDVRHHPCGCVTYFDLGLWRSVVHQACETHIAREEGRA